MEITLAAYSSDAKCAAQHFGPWMVDPRWMTGALDAVQSGVYQAAAKGEESGPGDYIVEDGLAHLAIRGHITKYPSTFGGTSSVLARRQLRAAAADDAVDAIMLHVDSPGGMAWGTGELANDIRAIKVTKPIYAHIEDLGASAAYWIASQATRVTATDSTEVGSIGTYMVLRDASEAASKEGLKVHVISTGAHKGAGVFGSEVTDEQLKQVQAEVNDLNDVFLNAVGVGRGLTLKAGESPADGRIFIASKAVDTGLIDGITSQDDAIALARADVVKTRGRDANRRSAARQIALMGLESLN